MSFIMHLIDGSSNISAGSLVSIISVPIVVIVMIFFYRDREVVEDGEQDKDFEQNNL